MTSKKQLKAYVSNEVYSKVKAISEWLDYPMSRVISMAISNPKCFEGLCSNYKEEFGDI